LPKPVPHTAHEIAKASFQRALADQQRSTRNRIMANIREAWVIGRSAHRWFYVTLLIITVLPILRHGAEIICSLSKTAVHLWEFAGSTIKSAFFPPQGIR